ncbi:hypothetical protein ACQKKX_02460 [Neorhizobium sp. NPDC001467]|uniref:hypothetical protein n=1 Tax=Neorhizobium sp. NPDC001467 TaxID=3390595 RepID=UPI003D078C76
MPDVNISSTNNLLEKMKDMGNGTHARVIATAVVNSDGTSASVLPAGTNRSGAITTGGTAQSLAPANAARKMLSGQNISAGDLWINEIGGAAAIDAAGSYKITAGASFKINTNQAVSIIGATTGQKFTATET